RPRGALDEPRGRRGARASDRDPRGPGRLAPSRAGAGDLDPSCRRRDPCLPGRIAHKLRDVRPRRRSADRDSARARWGCAVSPRQWFETELALPATASVEVYANDAGQLACVLEVHCDAVTLVQLADTLRAAVIEIDAQRADLAAREGSS